jgi:uncharacterized alkaline shock family protein YloU
MAMMAEHEQLPCGAELEPLIVQVADNQPPADPAHQADCPYCQSALRTVRQGWQDLQVLAHQPVSIPSALTAQVMARVRALARQVTDFILLGDPRGKTRISHALVGTVIQRVASTVPGVAFASAQAIPLEPPEAHRIRVAIRLVVTFGPAIDTLAHALRALIDRHVPTLTGAQLSRIDISIEDIADRRD